MRDVRTTAAGADFYGFLDDVAAVLTLRVWNVEGVVGCSILDGKIHQFQVLFLGEVILQVTVQSRTAIGELIGLTTVQDKLVEHTSLVVSIIEVGIVEVFVLGNPVAVLLVPAVVLAAKTLGRHNLAVEQEGTLLVVDAMLLVLLLDSAKDYLQELYVLSTPPMS